MAFLNYRIDQQILFTDMKFYLSGFRCNPQALLTSLATVFALSGCGSVVLKPVAQENRDTSGKFDGQYNVTQLKAPLTQHIERWVFTCPVVQQTRNFPMFVRDGKIGINVGGGEPAEAYVDASGRFRAEYALQGVIKEKAGSFESITRGNRTLIVQGRMSDSERSSGQITWGVEQFGNAGCSARLTFEKVS